MNKPIEFLMTTAMHDEEINVSSEDKIKILKLGSFVGMDEYMTEDDFNS